MSEFTVDEQMSFAAQRAKEIAAEKHFYDLNQPHYPYGFSVGHRNDEHWDIYAQRCPGKASAWKAAHPEGQTTETDDARERAFRIRGQGKEIIVFDERWNPHKPHPRGHLEFRSVAAAMIWIADELMQEPPADPPSCEAAP